MKKFYLLFSLLCTTAMCWAASNLCAVRPEHPAAEGTTRVLFSWNTIENGNVVVSIEPTEGTGVATFRNNGFTGDVNQFKVLSGDGFATEENASKYFYEKANVDGQTTYTLYRTGEYNLPSPCQIKYVPGAIEWSADNVGPYDNSSTIIYNYGTMCGSTLDAPEISVSSEGVVTFDAVAGADSYRAYVYLGSAFVKSILVHSGDKVLTPYLAGTYAIGVRAFNISTGEYSDMSILKDWNVLSGNINGELPQSSNNPMLVPDNGNPAYNINVFWDTEELTGNLLITLAPIDNIYEASTSWRGGGLAIGSFKYNGETFTDYFDFVGGIGTKTLVFSPKTGINAPTKGGIISFNGTVEWNCNNVGAWKMGVAFSDYIYGSGCGTLSRPIISDLTAEGVIAFTAVPEATSYKAYVYNSDKEKVYEQVVANGGTINYHPYLTDTYKVYLQALGADDAYSAYSAPMDWALEGNIAYLPTSEWCTRRYVTNGDYQSEDVNVTWSTDVTGNIVVVLSPVEGAEQTVSTAFRASMNINNLRVGEEAASTYFTSSHSNEINTFTLIDVNNKPAYGTTIYYDGMVEYRTGTHGTAYPTMHFEYIYGTTCDGYNDHTNPVISDLSVVTKDVHSVTLHVAATDVDDMGDSHDIATYEISSNDNGFVTTTVTPDGSGNFTVSGLVSNGTYTFTLRVIDAVGNETTQDIEVQVLFDPELNLSLGRGEYCSAGATQGANSANKAVDNNLETFWTSFATGDESTWWTIDLGVAYVVADVKITFNDIEAPYNIYASVDNTNWVPVVEGATASKDDLKDHADLTLAAQYFKVTSSKRNFGIKEFEVYGTAFAVADATDPEVAVTEISKTVNMVTLQIDATDLDDAGDPGTINAIHISGDNDFETLSNVSLDGENQITISGLKYNKTYTFTVHVLDLAGNETTQDIVVELPFNTNYNIALDGTATAGFSEAGHGAAKANDGDKENANSQWNSYGVDQSEGGYANNWWQVQFDAEYNLRSVKIVSKEAHNNQFVLEGSLDGSTYYKMAESVITAVGTDEIEVSAPAQYMRFSCANAYCSIYEFEVYASGFSTLTDAQPVVTYTQLGDVADVTAEIEVDAADITTKPITKYMVSGLGGEPVEVTATEGKIALTGLTQSTHYTALIQAKDEAGNLSETKQVEFTTTGSASGLYLHSDLHGWDVPDEVERFSTTAVSGVMSFTANFNTGTHTYKLYNADNARCTRNDCSGVTDHLFQLAEAKDVTFYATDEDHFICSEDILYLRGSLVGDDQAMEWNDAHTQATWTGTLDLSGTKEFTVVKKNQVGETLHTYDRDFYAEAQVFGGDFTFGTFTLDATKMEGSWDYVGLSFADNSTINSTTIATYADKTANVTINRSIAADDTWYTLCLPFDMSAERVEEVFGESTIATLSSSEDRGTMISLNFDFVDAIEAGKPYLIKVGTNFAAGTVIRNVQIKNVNPAADPQKAEAEHMHFQGTYDALTLTDENQRFVAGDNYLYSPNSTHGTPMGAFRCYFTIPAGSPLNNAPAKPARIVFAQQSTTGLGNAENQLQCTKVIVNGQLLIIREGRTYNTQGQLVK